MMEKSIDAHSLQSLYYDRSQSHLMEDKQLNKSRSKYDRYTSKQRDIPDIDGFCGHSPSLQSSPRYGVKSGHGERKSDKDRSSTDRRNDDGRQNSHGYKDARNKDQKLKDHKAEVHKLAEKVCGDWSEHVSSSGKRYYYNCKTEVSQWERPDGWVEASVMLSSSRTPRPKDASEKLPNTSHKGQRDWSKQHSSGDKNSTKSTPTSSSQQSLRLNSNNSKSDGLANDDSQSGRTTVAVVTNSFSRPRSSSMTPSSKASSEGNAAAGNDGPMPANCQETNYTERTVWKEFGAVTSPNHLVGTPVNVSGIYGLVASSGGVATSNEFHHLRQHGPINDFGYPNVMKPDDMDISPGSTPTEESMLQRHASVKASNSSAAVGTPVSTPHSLEQPGSMTPLASLTPIMTPSSTAPDRAITTSSTSLYNQTVLTTLAALQQAVSQLTVDKTPTLGSAGGIQRPQASSLLSCLALLPALISQLNTDKLTNSQTRPHERQQNQQITKQAIEMLQKLQQALVAQQQQQQQQRQLQQLLLQLLSVQKNSSRPSNSSSSQWTTPPPSKQIKLDSSSNVEDVKSESPYSPPDSDGTPLGTPDTRPHLPSITTQVSGDNSSSNLLLEAPKSNEIDVEAMRHPSPLPASAASLVQPLALGTSQLAAAVVHRKQDSTDLTPSLANYFNSQLIEHVSGWQVDITERQADCFAEESHTIGSIHCTQVSVELKRARSLVRANEIQSTLHEQRIMFLHQRYRELEQGQTVFMPQDT